MFYESASQIENKFGGNTNHNVRNNWQIELLETQLKIMTLEEQLILILKGTVKQFLMTWTIEK